MTLVIQTGRRSGRTTQMIQLVRTHPDAVLVVYCQQERERLLRMPWLDGRALAPEQVITPTDTPLRGRSASGLYVDNLDLVLGALLGCPSHLEAISL